MTAKNEELVNKNNNLEKRIEILEKTSKNPEKTNKILGKNTKIFDSNIITDPDRELIVLNWIPNKVISAELIIDTYRDGDSFDSFKNRCEGKSPTLVLIKTTQDIIFGVFTTVP